VIDWLLHLPGPFLEQLDGRIDGPMAFRLILQPIAAAVFAIRSGMRDGRMGKPLYFWALLSDRSDRREMLRDGWKDIGRIIVLAILMDLAYQILVFRSIQPLQAVIVAAILALLPYLIVRGVANRITRRWLDAR
jgi:hypothetical protein